MLTQVYDLRVTPVGSPLEAALLETDEIKKWNPPYNIALKTGRRELVFFNRDFTSSQAQACEEHFIGPFSSAMALDSMLRLCNSLQSKEFDENMFYEPMEISLLQEGFKIFCERHAFVPETFTSMRAILAVGLNWYRQLAEEVEDLEAEESTEETESTTIDQPLDESSGQSDEDEVVVTAEDIADKFERHFTRAGATYLRTKKLTQLLNSSIEIQKQSTTKKSKSPEKMQLRIRNGEVLPSEAEASDKLKIRWQNLSIETYDRMTVLFTEINKLKDQDHQIVIENI
jgi:DNA polymerase-3 subunit epsilon